MCLPFHMHAFQMKFVCCCESHHIEFQCTVKCKCLLIPLSSLSILLRVVWHYETATSETDNDKLTFWLVTADHLLQLPYIPTYKPTIFGSVLMLMLWGRLMRGLCHTARVDSQHDGYLSATLTVCEPHMTWTISRSIGLHGCMGESMSAGAEWPHTDLCCCCCTASHCNYLL